MNNTDYQATIDWLFNQLPMYQNVGTSAYKKDLTNILNLDSHLNHPHRYYPTIHVAGTNGKGTTCHMIAAILQSAGYKVGLYTSPHLKDFRERIKINGNPIAEDEVVHFVNQNKSFFEENKLSFFEMTVGMAYEAFKNHQVDIAVIEVGLGGRLDSTNIITPILSIITSIDLDHTDILGNTVEEIAREKAGIIKEKVPVVINEYRSNLRKLFSEIAATNNTTVEFAFAETNDLPPNQTPEQQNAQLASLAIKTLCKNDNWDVSSKHVSHGITNYRSITKLMGRYQILETSPLTIADIAHNPAGIKALIKRIQQEDYANLHVVFGAVKGKDIEEVIAHMPANAHYYLALLENMRSITLNDLVSNFEKVNYQYQTFTSTALAVQAAKEKSKSNDLILITGSTFLIAEII